jgi:CHASE3 domain sensor protein
MTGANTNHQPRAQVRRSPPGRTIALLLIVACATGLFFIGIGNQVRDEEDSVVALQALRAEIATAESSLRGYTLTGRQRFLEPYRLAVPAVRDAVDDVKAAMSDDNRDRIDSVERLFGEWRQRFAEPTIGFVRNDRRQDAEALAQTGRGKVRIDRIGALLADEIAEEQEETKESQRVARFLGAAAIVGIVALCIAVGIAWRAPRPPRSSGVIDRLGSTRVR